MAMLIYVLSEILLDEQAIKTEIQDLEEEEALILAYLNQRQRTNATRVCHYRTPDFFEVTIDR